MFLAMSLMNWCIINPIQDGGGEGLGQKDPLPVFPLQLLQTVISPQNFLTFSCNSFATLLQSFKFVPRISPKLLNLNQNHPSKKAVFLVKSV